MDWYLTYIVIIIIMGVIVYIKRANIKRLYLRYKMNKCTRRLEKVNNRLSVVDNDIIRLTNELIVMREKRELKRLKKEGK